MNEVQLLQMQQDINNLKELLDVDNVKKSIDVISSEVFKAKNEILKEIDDARKQLEKISKDNENKGSEKK